MLALEYRYDKISVLLVDIGVDILYRHFLALAASRRLSLYTSDAADDFIGLDLGGCRISEKKKQDDL